LRQLNKSDLCQAAYLLRARIDADEYKKFMKTPSVFSSRSAFPAMYFVCLAPAGNKIPLKTKE
jgi:hypothetical protein